MPRLLTPDFISLVLAITGEIPPGKVATYGQIARLAGKERNARAVGRIMASSELYGDFPCHRVVDSKGRLCPFWPEQRELLEKEGVTMKDGDHVDIRKHRWEI